MSQNILPSVRDNFTCIKEFINDTKLMDVIIYIEEISTRLNVTAKCYYQSTRCVTDIEEEKSELLPMVVDFELE